MAKTRSRGKPRSTDRAAAPSSPREAVCDHLVRQVRRFPDLDLSPPDTRALEARDAALAHALYDAVIRHWLTIRRLVELSSGREFGQIDPVSKSALLSGGAQLLFLDKVPSHAAVSESVEWVKRRGRAKGSGFVNAVLRRIAGLRESAEVGSTSDEPARWKAPSALARNVLPLSDGRVLRLSEDVLPEEPLERLGVATSHPRRLLAAWEKRHGPDRLVELALHSLVHPPLILNTEHAERPLPAGLTAHERTGHHVLEASAESLQSVLEGRNDIWVQDPASAEAVRQIAPLDPGLIVDSCAGMGTKTRQLAGTFPGARIVATDVDRDRRAMLRRVFSESDQVEVVEPDDLLDLAGSVDLVLLDVPCSNTGVLARRPEARYRFDRVRENELGAMQRQILADSVRLVRGGARPGRVLYSTCSLEPAENAEQMEWLTRWHQFRITRTSEMLPRGLPGESARAYSDGAFASLAE